MKNVFLLAQILMACSALVAAQNALGEAAAIDQAKKEIKLKTNAGEVLVLVDETTKFLRVAPGEKTLERAERIALADIAAGDRLLARGKLSEDKTTIAARQVIVMSTAAIVQKHEQDRKEWETRGIIGTITALNPETKEITIRMRTTEGPKPVIIQAEDGVTFRRYAPDSVKFADTRVSSFAELKVGDQVRALGEKKENGWRFLAEMIVSGTFLMAGGPITAINQGSGELTIRNLPTQKPLTVVINKDSVLRRIPSDLVKMLAQRRASTTPMSADLQQMLENVPAIGLADLEPGDMVLVSSTQGADPSRVTAIHVASGVEALFRSQEGPAHETPATSLSFGDFLDFGVGLPPG